jgi:cobalt/nickel transport system ATP-binding protein
MKELLALKDINYSYHGKIPALKNINLSVMKGEMYAIIGLNGSGKSTLLNIINALVFPDSGSVLFDGRIVDEKSMNDRNFTTSFRQRMGYIFQNPDIQLFCPTVFDELLFGPLQLNIPHEEAVERAEKTLAYLDISSLRERPVFMLSGGEKKKVAIASVLTMNPEVLLVDEPLASLDPKTQTFFTELLIELNRAGKTIIFTTHQLDLVEHLQPRVAVISDEHTIEKSGTAYEILTDQDLLIKVNLVHEHVHKHGNEEHRHFHSHYVFHKH